MPIPTGFPQVTNVLGKPPNWAEGDCGSLPVFTDGLKWVSKWSFSEVELNELQKTGVVWLTVHACGQPPVALDVLPPLYPVPSGKPLGELDGTCCPRCKSTEGIKRTNFMWVAERFGWDLTPKGRDVGPSTTVSECVKCGYQVQAATESDSRERRVCKAIHQITGEMRELNESMKAYQSRLIDKYGSEWPEMLQKIVTAVMTEE